MNIYLDCYPCFLRQALSAARRAGADSTQQHAVLLWTMAHLQTLAITTTPPEMAAAIHGHVRAVTGVDDPYERAKQDATAQALARYPTLLAHLDAASDPLECAVRIAIAGNIIDLGVAEQFDLDATLERVLVQPFAIDALDALRQRIDSVDQVLYLADNAGETVFDRPLLDVLRQRGLAVTYVVKAAPIINDATRADALAAGIADDGIEIIDNGAAAPGTLLEQCSAAFRERFAAAPLIVAKGQANYETLSALSAPIFFLLQAKCQVIAGDLHVPPGAIVLKGAVG